MSRINDALKQAKQAPQRNTPSTLSSMQSTPEDSSGTVTWLVPIIVIVLIVAAIFFIGWAAAHNTVNEAITLEQKNATAPVTEDDTANTDMAQDTNNAAADTSTATNVTSKVTSIVITNALPNDTNLPSLQGIFYSPNPRAATAILDGRTVRVGDSYLQYRVKEITKFAIVLVGPDNKEIRLSM
jgi:hypothetical protein